jgi:uncharacterized protein DUF1918
MAKQQRTPATAQIGDLVEARGIHGQPPRRGEIVELLDSGSRTRYRVSWEREQESILYPADGVLIMPRRRATRHARS